MACKRVVIICIDNTDHSLRGFHWYLENLHQKDHEVGLVHVYVQPNIPNIGLFGAGFSALETYRQDVERSIDVSRLVVKKYKDICAEKGIAAKCHVPTVDVSVGRTIVKIANEQKAILIVIGSRGLGPIKSTLFGSVSDYILRNTCIPTIVIPPFSLTPIKYRY